MPADRTNSRNFSPILGETPIRRGRSDTERVRKKTDGEKFAQAVGLQAKSKPFSKLTAECRLAAHEEFDFDRPLEDQSVEMDAFVREVTKNNPDLFPTGADGERIKRLQRYAVTYLTKCTKYTQSVSGALSALATGSLHHPVTPSPSRSTASPRPATGAANTTTNEPGRTSQLLNRIRIFRPPDDVFEDADTDSASRPIDKGKGKAVDWDLGSNKVSAKKSKPAAAQKVQTPMGTAGLDFASQLAPSFTSTGLLGPATPIPSMSKTLDSYNQLANPYGSDKVSAKKPKPIAAPISTRPTPNEPSLSVLTDLPRRTRSRSGTRSVTINIEASGSRDGLTAPSLQLDAPIEHPSRKDKKGKGKEKERGRAVASHESVLSSKTARRRDMAKFPDVPPRPSPTQPTAQEREYIYVSSGSEDEQSTNTTKQAAPSAPIPMQRQFLVAPTSRPRSSLFAAIGRARGNKGRAHPGFSDVRANPHPTQKFLALCSPPMLHLESAFNEVLMMNPGAQIDNIAQCPNEAARIIIKFVTQVPLEVETLVNGLRNLLSHNR